MLELRYVSRNNLYAEDQSTRDLLKKGFFGKQEGGKLKLSIDEALYLMDVRNARCLGKDGEVSFSDLSSKFANGTKFMARYFTYRDWRERGLVIKEPEFAEGEAAKHTTKSYPAGKLRLPDYKLHGTFFKSDLTCIMEESEHGKELYEKFWLGQYGSYKAAERGQLNKLDVYETLFLLDKGLLTLKGTTRKAVIKAATSRRKDFLKLYEVYRDWREKGFVIKTGFKFGTNFRVYFPGARPIKDDNDWVHSKHVIHVFPKESKLLISEWARAIRVAHSVRKTFILAVPGNVPEKKMKVDFILYHRRGGESENPDNTPPRYAMLSLSEEEYIGGKEFAGAIKEAKSMKLDLILAIADRETAVTYYKVRQIKLPGSASDYYEIDWMQP